MNEKFINDFHLAITFITLLVYVILCFISEYKEASKMDKMDKNIAFSRIIFGFLSGLFILSLEVRYISATLKDSVFLRSVQLLISLVMIGFCLYANENKRVSGDRFDIISKVLSPLMVAFSISSSGSLNNILNYFKNPI